MDEPDRSGRATQGLAQRMPPPCPLTQAGAAWARQQHPANGRVAWRFTTQDPRIQQKRLYPALQLG